MFFYTTQYTTFRQANFAKLLDLHTMTVLVVGKYSWILGESLSSQCHWQIIMAAIQHPDHNKQKQNQQQFIENILRKFDLYKVLRNMEENWQNQSRRTIQNK